MRRILIGNTKLNPSSIHGLKKKISIQKNGADMCFLWKYDLDDCVLAMLLIAIL